MKDSIAYAIQFVNTHKNNEITMVGHSKGGAEAAANAVATNTNSILFNPASVNLSAYGLNKSDYTASMTAYIVKGEILNNLFGPISSPIGTVVFLPTQYKTPRWVIGTARTIMNQYNAIKNHSMSAVISALKEAGYN
jgi:hypothetical protein